MSKLKFKSGLPVLALLLSLQACGYHLRGAVDIPPEMKSVYVEGAGAGLHKELKAALKAADGTLVGSPETAGIVIKVVRDDMRRRVLSLDQQGKSTEFELNYTVDFVLLDSAGKILQEQQQVEINRDFFNDQVDILAKNNEEQIIRDEIYRQAVRTIVARARAVLKP
jgi:LPS-assembly lipoprotein